MLKVACHWEKHGHLLTMSEVEVEVVSKYIIIEESGEGSPLIFFNKLKSPPNRRALLQTLLR